MAVESGAQYSRRARLAEVGRWLWVSLALATLFAVVQAMGMADLLHAHQLSLTTRAIIGLNGLAFSSRPHSRRPRAGWYGAAHDVVGARLCGAP